MAFESEKYFSDYREDLLNEFRIKNEEKFFNNKYLDIIKNKNVISICVRIFIKIVIDENIQKSRLFVENTIKYINKAKMHFK